MINKSFESYINDNYLIGLPSGQIIDIHYKMINNLKQEGYICWSSKFMGYIFKDENYIKILKYLKMPLPEEKNSLDLEGIQEFFDKQKYIRSYLIDKDGINVHGDVYVSDQNYKNFPFDFKEVTGDFIFKNCKLQSLEGGPKKVGGHFNVSHNDLIDLFGGPKYVGKSYNCSNNKLLTLGGSPKNITSDFDCSNNKIENFSGGPQKVKGFFDCSGNNIKDDTERPECFKMIIFSKAPKRFRNEGDGKWSW